MGSLKRVIAATARPAELALGVVFLAGAVLKVLAVNLFTVQIRSYGLLDDPTLLALSALATLGVETALGAALFLGWRWRGRTHAAVMALLVVFTGLIVYGWVFNDLEDCGCFGPIEMSPGISIGKNVVLFLSALVAALGLRGAEPGGNAKRLARLRPLACAGLAAAIVLYAYAHLEPVVETTPESGPFAQFAFEEDGVRYDLGKGEYLVVVLLNTTCEHCMASVESLNELALIPGFPPIVGLCYEEEPGLMDEFRELTEPLFPLYSLGDRIRTFFALLGDAPAPPRFIYVRDGQEFNHWDEKAPEAKQVFLARAGASPVPSQRQ